MAKNTDSEVTYTKLRRRAGDRYCKVSENTQNGWFTMSVPSSPVEISETKKALVYLFEVVIPENAEDESSDVMNLQYFFIRTDRALRHKLEAREKALFILYVQVHNWADFSRVASYLYLQSLHRQDMRFYIGHEGKTYGIKQETNSIGRLPPLICVERQNSFLRDVAGNNCFTFKQFANGKLTKEQIDNCIEIANEILSLPSLDERKAAISTIPERLRNGSTLDSFQWICANYLAKTISSISGTTEHQIRKEERSRLSKELSKHILSKEPEEASLLTLLIWFVYLYYMQDNKELFTWTESAKVGGAFELRKERIDKSYLDSREYAEGVLQLVENSCQHTQNGVAYLSLRVHYVNRNCRESDLVKVATSRNRLIQRYSKDLKLSKDYNSYFPRRLSLEGKIPFYFEICIADDATSFDGNKDEPRGIPEMYARNHIWKTDGDKDTSVELCHVFGRRTEYGMPEKMANTIDEMSEDNLKLVTYHYGVRQLQKIVLRNSGSFLVKTPSMKRPGFVEAYSAYSETKLPDPPPGETWEDRIIIPELAFQRRGIGWQQLQFKSDTKIFSTEYQLLLPIGGAWRKRAAAGVKLKGVKPTDLPIDLSALKDGLSYSVSKNTINFRSIIETVKEENPEIIPFSLDDKKDRISKKEFVEKISERLQSELKKESITEIKLLDFSSISGSDLEFAVKAFFWTIGLDRLEQNNSPKSRRLYAAFFSELSQMQEFILDYSVFYNENGQNPYMDNIQIAVCSQNEDGLPEVNFLLAGTSIGAAWKTADIFAYYSNSNNTISLLPQLKYLLRDQETPNDDPVIPFPFDLYLRDYPGKTEDTEKTATDNKKSVIPAPANDCWFTRQMADIINRDLREERLGCKIENIHIRLGSKMHIEDFYEAELLFHSLSIVTRFAYLIVQHILSSSFFDRDRPVLLVGYEAYSTILLEYVVKFLSACNVNSNYGVCVQELSGKAVFQPSAALQRADERSEYSNGCNLVTIYPIGTTLSTVYTLIDCVLVHYPAKPLANICVLVVEDTSSDNKLQSLYWTRMLEKPGMTGALPLERSVITLEKAKEEEEYSMPKVRFFLEAKTIWHAPSECMEAPPEKEKENVLAYVDPTSTIPDTIFPLISRKNDGPEQFLKKEEEQNENYKRIRLLNDCVSYGHIHSGNNHFLYHVDFPLYFEKVRDSEISKAEEDNRPKSIDYEMSKWADKIDPEAYNIIVAPLDPENAAFVQTVADSAFAHSVRIIRVPFQNVRKEDFRAKYSFISDEYRRVNKLNPDIKIHLYFVTMSIVTGATFWRASKLMSMLLEDSGCYAYTEKVFKGIFALVNRSSPSTIQTMLENPEADFHAYLHLSVPHFNTFEGICPFCVRHQKIKRFMDDCATNTVLRSFSRMEKKHAVRSPEEHKSWLKDELWHSPGDFSALCLWLYHHVKGEKGKNTKNDKEFLFDLRDNCLKLVNDPKGKKPIRLEDHRDLFADRDQIEQLWLKNIMGERAYLRLVCTHNSFCFLESNDLLKTSSNDLPREAMRTILKDLLLYNPEPDEPQYIEWLFSYIKVLSRDYLSKYHYIQEASFKIMITLLCCLLDEKSRSSMNLHDTEIDEFFKGIVKRCNAILPLQKYQLIMVLFHQLAEMQANTVIRGDVLFDFWKAFEKLKKDQEELCQKDEYAKLCPLPSDEKAAQDYYRCVKLCLLYGDEENKSLLLQDVNDGQSIWK